MILSKYLYNDVIFSGPPGHPNAVANTIGPGMVLVVVNPSPVVVFLQTTMSPSVIAPMCIAILHQLFSMDLQ